MYKLMYSGVFTQPHDQGVKSCMAYIANILDEKTKSDLVLFLLTPGLFQEAYDIASKVSYRNVYIFVPSNDFLFISDVVRLQNELSKTKEKCKVIFPRAFPDEYSNVEFRNNLIKKNSIIINNGDFSISVKYVKTDVHNVYNIHVYDSNHGFCLSSFINEEILDALNEEKEITEVHIPYTKSLYGGLTFADTVKKYNLGHRARKLVCNSFTGRSEYHDCVNKYHNRHIVDRAN